MYYLQIKRGEMFKDLTTYGESLSAESIDKLMRKFINSEFNPQEFGDKHFQIVKREFKIVDYLEDDAPKIGGLWYLQVDTSTGWKDCQERYTAITALNLSTLINRVISIPARLSMSADYRVIYRVVETIETVVS